jgi:hypothetical protein
MDATIFLTCNRCRGRIGTYEPIWWRRPDGSLDESSFLGLRDHPLREDPGSAFFHKECLSGAALGGL